MGRIMESETKLRLENSGIDVEDVLERFMGNEKLMERFLKKFIDDPHFPLLFEAFDQQDYEKAFQEAHTLKGVCGNLSMTTLFEQVSFLVECLRVQDHTKAKEQLFKIKENHEKIIETLKEIYGNEKDQ